ncbi:hypothetical protein GGI07_001092 [Coemansia sp. Benny D115]|nr:hypothetical protein GGI07_001092 [Coemansia sp. Benny D115]
MDPLRPESFTHRYATVNGIRMHYVDEGAGPATVLCVHGFPDLWYGWRYQIPFLVSLGYRVLVPDMRGYGQTDAPTDVSTYSAKNIVKDLVSLLDIAGVDRAVWAGHDWGGMHVWRATMWHPERVLGVISFCTPFSRPLSTKASLEDIVAKRPYWKYQLYLAKSDTPDELDHHIDLFLNALLRKHTELLHTSVMSSTLPLDQRSITDTRDAPRSTLLSQNELMFYIQQYKINGLRGPTNYYRVHELNWEQEHAAGFGKDFGLDKLCMMVTCGHDTALPPTLSKDMESFIPRLMREHVEECGHWMLVEQRDFANAALKKYLGALKTNTVAKI